MIAEHRPEFLNAGLHMLCAVMHNHELLITLNIRCDRTGSHVAVMAENGISYIIIVRGLYMIEQNDIFQLDRVADHAVRADQR